MSDTRNPDELGALWVKSGPKGEYMTGTVNGVNVVCFRNDRQSNPKAPQWRVMKSKPRDEQRPQASRPAATHAPTAAPTDTDDEMPW